MKTKIIKSIPLVCFILVAAVVLDVVFIKTTFFILNPVPTYGIAEVNAQEIKTYKYNEQVPVEVIKEEIRKQARVFGIDEEFMITLIL